MSWYYFFHQDLIIPAHSQPTWSQEEQRNKTAASLWGVCCEQMQPWRILNNCRQRQFEELRCACFGHQYIHPGAFLRQSLLPTQPVTGFWRRLTCMFRQCTWGVWAVPQLSTQHLAWQLQVMRWWPPHSESPLFQGHGPRLTGQGTANTQAGSLGAFLVYASPSHPGLG